MSYDEADLRRGGVERDVRLERTIGLIPPLRLLIRATARFTEVAPVQRHWIEVGPVDESSEHKQPLNEKNKRQLTCAKEMVRELPVGGGVIVVVDVRPAERLGVEAGAVALCRAARRLAASRSAEFSAR